MSTNSQIRANRTNSQKSTGPHTPEGKAASSANSHKHGIYSTAILLPHEDPDAYRSLTASFLRDLSPIGALELALVQRMADMQWRMLRYDSIEASLYARDLQADLERGRDHSPTDAFRAFHHDGFLEALSRQYARAERTFRRAMTDLAALQSARRSVQSAPSKAVTPKLASFPRSLSVLQPAPPPLDDKLPMELSSNQDRNGPTCSS